MDLNNIIGKKSLETEIIREVVNVTHIHGYSFVVVKMTWKQQVFGNMKQWWYVAYIQELSRDEFEVFDNHVHGRCTFGTDGKAEAHDLLNGQAVHGADWNHYCNQREEYEEEDIVIHMMKVCKIIKCTSYRNNYQALLNQ